MWQIWVWLLGALVFFIALLFTGREDIEEDPIMSVPLAVFCLIWPMAIVIVVPAGIVMGFAHLVFWVADYTRRRNG